MEVDDDEKKYEEVQFEIHFGRMAVEMRYKAKRITFHMNSSTPKTTTTNQASHQNYNIHKENKLRFIICFLIFSLCFVQFQLKNLKLYKYNNNLLLPSAQDRFSE